MKIFKFGGASVKDAEAVKNVASILNLYKGEKIVVVISAMGKTTNMLEELINRYYHKTGNPGAILEEVTAFHFEIMHALFPDRNHPVFAEINNCFVEIEWSLEDETGKGYAFIYDQVVAVGELISSKIISAYLNDNGSSNHWLDVRDCIRTDNTYREGIVDWECTCRFINEVIPAAFNKDQLIVTQGFIGSTSENFTTTLGREGSDYSAAILAYGLNAEQVVIWKDVPGILNADPKWFEKTTKLDQLSYNEAIELSYYGATVIHPKTIKPLQNKAIPLYVKSFIVPVAPGTVICDTLVVQPLIPSFIFKINQMLLSISANDFSFIIEENLSIIFGLFANHGVKINLMQNSAISFSVCIDNDPFKVPPLIDELKQRFKVLYNDQLELVTIRHYNQEVINEITQNKEIFIEQKSRNTAQFVIKDKA